MRNLIKFILFLICTIGVFFINSYIILASIAIFNLILMIIIKVNINNAINNLVKLLPFILFTFFINILFADLKFAMLIGVRLILVCNLSYIFFIAFTIAVGELGDKTFLASIGLGIEYSIYKASLICGAIAGMVISDLIAIIFGKALANKIPESIMQKLSGILFLIFGFIGLLNFLF